MRDASGGFFCDFCRASTFFNESSTCCRRAVAASGALRARRASISATVISFTRLSARASFEISG
jgi:hypothetical protein